MSTPIYLDHAAATPADDQVLTAMQPYLQTDFYNPSATYLAGKRTRAALEQARSSVAQVLGARASEVIFTAGASEANNLAIQGIMKAYPGQRVLVSAIEHASVLETAEQYAMQALPVTGDGLLDVAAARQLLTDDVVLISVMYANNEVGTVQPLKTLAALAQDVRKQRLASGNLTPLYLHTDATQAPNYLDIHVSRLGIDLLTVNGGKIYGPKQTGMLYVRTGVSLQPLIYGGGQERGLRSGTENVAGSVGFAKALEIAQAMRHAEAYRLGELQRFFFDELSKQIPQVAINGSRTQRLPNNVHITIPGQDNERLLMALDERGIMAAAGSACTASSEEPSHVLKAMGISERDARASLRFTMGRATTKVQLEQTVAVLAQLL